MIFPSVNEDHSRVCHIPVPHTGVVTQSHGVPEVLLVLVARLTRVVDHQRLEFCRRDGPTCLFLQLLVSKRTMIRLGDHVERGELDKT